MAAVSIRVRSVHVALMRLIWSASALALSAFPARNFHRHTARGIAVSSCTDLARLMIAWARASPSIALPAGGQHWLSVQITCVHRLRRLLNPSNVLAGMLRPSAGTYTGGRLNPWLGLRCCAMVFWRSHVSRHPMPVWWPIAPAAMQASPSTPCCHVISGYRDFPAFDHENEIHQAAPRINAGSHP